MLHALPPLLLLGRTVRSQHGPEMNNAARHALMQLIESAATNGYTPNTTDASVLSLAPTEEGLTLLSSSVRGAQPQRTVIDLRPRMAVHLSVETTVAEAAKLMAHANADAALILSEVTRFCAFRLPHTSVANTPRVRVNQRAIDVCAYFQHRKRRRHPPLEAVGGRVTDDQSIA